MSDQIEAIYSPSTGKIACVLLQAAFKGSRHISMLFDAGDWDVAPRDTMRRTSATLEEWRQLAALSRRERVEAYEALQERMA